MIFKKGDVCLSLALGDLDISTLLLIIVGVTLFATLIILIAVIALWRTQKRKLEDTIAEYDKVQWLSANTLQSTADYRESANTFQLTIDRRLPPVQEDIDDMYEVPDIEPSTEPKSSSVNQSDAGPLGREPGGKMSYLNMSQSDLSSNNLEEPRTKPTKLC